MKKKYWQFAQFNTNLFPEPGTEGNLDDQGGGGGDEGNDDTVASGEGEDTLESGEGEGEEPKTPATGTIDPHAFAEAIGAVMAKHQPQVQAQNEPKLSPEEARKLLNDFDITDDFIKEFGNIETQKKAFETFKKQMVQHVDTINQVRLAQMQQQYEQRFTPVQSMLEQFQAQQAESAFYGAYPVLNKPELRPFIVQAASELRDTGAFKPGNNAHNFKVLATKLEKTIQAVNPAFKLSAATQNKSTPQPRRGGIAPTTSGQSGGGGNGGGGGAAPGTPAAVKLFPKIGG